MTKFHFQGFQMEGKDSFEPPQLKRFGNKLTNKLMIQ